jgi:hypothetical protein
MKEYMLAILLEQKGTDEEFGRWPLHITLVPWFQLQKPLGELQEALTSELSTRQSFNVTVGPKKQWGVHTVHLIDSTALHSLHNNLLGVVKDHAKLTAPLRFTGKLYQPHITQKSYARVERGFKVSVKQVYLIEAPKKNPLTRLKKVVTVGVLL